MGLVITQGAGFASSPTAMGAKIDGYSFQMHGESELYNAYSLAPAVRRLSERREYYTPACLLNRRTGGLVMEVGISGRAA